MHTNGVHKHLLECALVAPGNRAVNDWIFSAFGLGLGLPLWNKALYHDLNRRRAVEVARSAAAMKLAMFFSLRL